MKRTMLTVFFVLLASALLVALQPTCGPSPILMADGTVTTDFIGASGGAYYWENLQGGHSYSVEAWDSYDTWHGSKPSLKLYTGSCVLGPSYQDITSITPSLGSTFSDRISWIQPSTGSLYIGMSNPDSAHGYNFGIRLTDTTLISPRWTTYGGYTTQYGFVNTTNTPINGTLTLYDQVSGGPYTMSITVAVGSRSVVTIPTTLVVPANHAGQATFAFVGPPGAIMADGFVTSASGTVILPITFAARSFQH